MSRTITVKMGDALIARLEETAKKLGTTRSALVRAAVSRFLAEALSKKPRVRGTIALVCPHCGKVIRVRLDLALVELGFNGDGHSQRQSHPPQSD